MPSRKPTQERIEQVRTQFQAAESKILEISKEPDKERHFRLLYNVALEAVDADLSKTAYRLWIYLSANYPFSDREVDLPSQTELGIRLGVTRQAINIAAAELQQAGLWDFWAERWKGRNLKGFGTPKEEGVKKNRQVSKKDDTVSKKDDTGCQKKMTPCKENLTPCKENLTPTTPESLSQADSKTSHTSSDYSDFIQTLSEGERENFENYCQRRASQEAKKPKAWIRTAWRDLWDDFQEHEAKRKANEAAIEASKLETTRKGPETAANEPCEVSKPSVPTADALNQHWQKAKAIGNSKLCKAIETQAHSLGYEVAENGIAGELKDSDQGNSSGRGFKPPE